MNMREEERISSANRVLVSVALSLSVFWVLNILKTAYPIVKSNLTWYRPIGPLLGVYVVSIGFLLLFLLVLRVKKMMNQALAYWIYVVAIILFAVMVFPPVFEPIAHLLGGS